LKRLLASLVSLALLAASLPATGAAADPISQLRPLDLRVSGGEDAWHPDNSFRLDWDRPPAADALGVRAVHFRLRDSAGHVVSATSIPHDEAVIEYIHVPSGPGRYLADVWLESSDRRTGPAVSAVLRFDDVRPGSARPLAPTGWVGGDATATLKLERPEAPLPISGIRGYAVSVERGAASPPCAGPDRCSLAETDVRAGLAGDTVSLPRLSEGTHVVSAVAVSGSGMRSAQALSATIRVDASDPEVALEAPAGWHNGPVQVRALATDRLSGMAAAGPSGPYTAIAVDGALPRTQLGPVAVAAVTGEGRHQIAVHARDDAGNTAGPRTTLVQIDESPPAIAFARSQDPTEPERIEATVSDALSGPDLARGSLGFRPAGTRQRFQVLETTAVAGKLVARWDSDASAPGTYEFRATAYDLAGNESSSDRRTNGTRMVLANPLKAVATIEAGFGGRRLIWQRCRRHEGQRRCRHEAIAPFEARPRTRTVPFGGGVSFSGRLTSIRGVALGGLPVEVVETFDAGSTPTRRTTLVRTAADGSFQIQLTPGPGRQVAARFSGTRVLTRAAADPVRLAVLGDVRFRASVSTARIGGAPVFFRGRVGNLGAPIPAEGRPVELQFRFPGADWAEFRTVQTDRHGRFHYPYAFSDDDSRGIRFQFRAYAPAQEGWPYEPAFSRPVFVTGR